MKEMVELPLRNLSRRPKRSIITLLGIIIGVTAIISLTAMGDGLRASIAEEFESLGANTIYISPGEGIYSVGAISGAMTKDDVNKIESVRGVDEVSDFYFSVERVCYRDDCESTWVMFVRNPDVWSTAWPIEKGRMPDNHERTKAALGAYVGRDLFDRELRVGDRIEIKDITVDVVGIAESIGSPEDDRSIVLGDGARETFGVGEVVSGAMAIALEAYDPREVAERIKDELEQNNEKTFTVESFEDLLENMNSVLGAVTWVFLGIAGISILVGGIGITNTMYMSIRERTREIGVMKAIGATHGTVRELIVIEAGLLGATGGLIGTLLGWSIATVATMVARMELGVGFFSARVSPQLVALALVFSFTVGVVSGYLPARDASRLSPVEALRYE